MSRGTFWCLVITTERGVALMFVVKLAKNFKKTLSNRLSKNSYQFFGS